jgi:hypothetical protein
MTTGIYTFLKWLAGEITANVALQARCTALYGSTMQAFVGVDDQQLPEDTKAPMVILIGGGRALSDGSMMRSMSAKMCIATKSETKPATTLLVTSFATAEYHDEITWMVYEIIIKARETTGKFSVDVSPGPDDANQFPVFKSWLGLSIQQDSDIT